MNKKIPRNEKITDKLLRIESSLLNGGYPLSTDFCVSYISWAMKFGKVTDNEAEYLADLVCLANGYLTADEEEVLLTQVATRPIQ